MRVKRGLEGNFLFFLGGGGVISHKKNLGGSVEN